MNFIRMSGVALIFLLGLSAAHANPVSTKKLQNVPQPSKADNPQGEVATPAKAVTGPVQEKSPADGNRTILYTIMVVMGLGVLFGVVMQGFVGMRALEGVARNPGAKKQIQPILVLTLALIESIVIYALLVTVLLYAKL